MSAPDQQPWSHPDSDPVRDIKEAIADLSKASLNADRRHLGNDLSEAISLQDPSKLMRLHTPHNHVASRWWEELDPDGTPWSWR
jgi:hypothetical protein